MTSAGKHDVGKVKYDSVQEVDEEEELMDMLEEVQAGAPRGGGPR